ncbi:stage V sporulation protein S [Clostridium cavendishii DSM 21758]|uniref:Stage V sporulation protein S n=1 Tax=Clostridium cavendishii DSM 21758 TaxID=1121302 RepID=A0A1M6K6S5_9CLOT|nr:stage V sporulation protein S [Clostridium cavendishii]SHJ54614.1 stage V sporulation protein S [Clostridium cavendishii DSM 21758]
MDILKVSTKSTPKYVAGVLATILRKNKVAEIQAIGPGAVNQAVKSITIARGFIAPNGMELLVIPAFSEVQIQGHEKTAIKFIVESR